MTTKNRIITKIFDSVLFIPIECIYANDSITYVYHHARKQQVIPGKSNESDIIILAGLKKGDEAYLQPPSNTEDWPIKMLDPSVVEKYASKEKKQKPPEEDDKNKRQFDPSKRKGDKGMRKGKKPQGK